MKRGGYLRVALCDGDGRADFSIHHLVLLAFTGPRPAGLIGRHLDDDVTNNFHGNLRWGTHAENVDDQRRNRGLGHAVRSYAKGEDHFRAKLTAKDVTEIRERYREGGVTQMQLAREFGISRGNVANLVRPGGRSWRHVG